MHLTPRELDKLMLHNVGFLAQKRLARGLRLNHPEAVALISTQLFEFIRDGDKTVAELMDLGKTLLGRRQVLPGVPELIYTIQVEGTFPDGTKLVTVHDPIANEDGDLALALHGSFLPVPDLSAFGDTSKSPKPGEVMTTKGDIVLNEGRETVQLEVKNYGDRPIQVGSHYHFVETNRQLGFDREAAYGKRLDIPAGTAVRFEPGEKKTVQLVAIGGKRVINGGNAAATGEVNDYNKEQAMKRLRDMGFRMSP
ncbi:MAG TPA: urease subunit beta [Polyangiales bacterium]|nr:urease subunit beta [Polyangiales bacterium]